MVVRDEQAAQQGKPDLPLGEKWAEASKRGTPPDGRDGSRRAGLPSNLGAAHTSASDAYRDVPILQAPTWNNEIAAYFYLGGISSGASMLGGLAELFGGPERQTLARTAHYVAFATMLPCPLLLIGDLGKRTKFHHMLRIFKPSSPMNLGAWFLTAHGAGSTLTALRGLAGEGKLPVLQSAAMLLPRRLLMVSGLPAGFGLGAYTGVLIGTTSTPVWFKSPLLGALFTTSALSNGVAATGLVSALTGRDNQSDHRAMAPLGAALSAAEAVMLAAYVATTGKAAKPLLRGLPGAMVAGAAVGTIAAAALEGVGAATGNKRLSAIAAAIGLTGGACLRWGVVRAGHPSSQDRAGTLEAMKPSRRAPGWGPSA